MSACPDDAHGVGGPPAQGTATAAVATDRITEREAQVLEALAERLTNREIAARLYVSPRTVESHVASLLRKCDAHDRRHLAELAKQWAQLRHPTVGLPPILELQVHPTTFFGRSPETEQFLEFWQRAVGGQTLIVFVSGEAGIGKSRFVAEIAARVHREGGQVMLGSCFGDHVVPYQAFAHAITDASAALTRQEFERRAGDHGPALGRVVPEVARLLDVTVDAEVVEPARAQAGIAAAVHHFLRATAGVAPLLFVFEDAHWATPSTLSILRHIARVGSHTPLLVAVTMRNAPPDLPPALVDLLTDIDRLPTVGRVPLAPLDPHDVRSLLRARGSDADATVVHRETGGNPLLVLELAREHGRERGVFTELLAQRYGLLGDDDLAVIDMASVLGTQFDANVLSRALARPIVDVLESLERAEAAGVVVGAPPVRGRFAFVHALFRTARYDALPSSRRLTLHHLVAQALEPYREDARALPMLARHACLAAPVGDVRSAIDFACSAAQLAERALAFDDAAEHYRAALDIVDLLEDPAPRLRLQLAIRLAEMLNRVGDPDSRSLFLDTAGTARDLGDGRALADIAWAMSQYGTAQSGAFTDHEVVGIAEDAVAALGAERSATRARALAVLSTALDRNAPPARPFELVTEALEIARELDDPITLAHVLIAYRVAGRRPGHRAARHPTADELVALGRRCNQPFFTVMGLVNRAWSHREEGNLVACDEAVERYAAMLGDHAIPPNTRSQLVLFRSMRALLSGDLERAEREAEKVLAITPHGGFDPLGFYGPALMVIRHFQGRFGELAALLETMPKGSHTLEAAQALAYAWDDRPEEASAVLDALARRGVFAGAVTADHLGCALLSCETAVMTARRDLASRLGDVLRPHAGHLADAMIVVLGPVDHALAQAAYAAGDDAQAVHFATAATVASRERRTPIFLGRELVTLAAARRRAGAPARAVAPLVDEALEIAERTGADAITADVARMGFS